MSQVRPLGDRVLVRVVARERVTTGGVILPDQAREQSDRGYVLAVGPGTPEMQPMYGIGPGGLEPGTPQHWVPSMRPVPVGVGEVVLFSPYAGVKVTHGNDDMLLLREHDVLGVLDGVEVEEDPSSGELRLKADAPALA